MCCWSLSLRLLKLNKTLQSMHSKAKIERLFGDVISPEIISAFYGAGGHDEAFKEVRFLPEVDVVKHIKDYRRSTKQTSRYKFAQFFQTNAAGLCHTELCTRGLRLSWWLALDKVNRLAGSKLPFKCYISTYAGQCLKTNPNNYPGFQINDAFILTLKHDMSDVTFGWNSPPHGKVLKK